MTCMIEVTRIHTVHCAFRRLQKSQCIGSPSLRSSHAALRLFLLGYTCPADSLHKHRCR
jgi:hypothetical protein